jgi:hypothetical protein
MNKEQPDAIGWRYDGLSILVECKTNRADYFADNKKEFRNYPGMKGMGQYRFYMTPKGLIKPEELKTRWGLLEVTEHKTFATHGKPKFPSKWGDYPPFTWVNEEAERNILLSSLRRMHLRGYLKDIYEGVITNG